MSENTFETLYHRVSHEASLIWADAMLWLSRRSDGEQLVIACVFILVLLLLIVRMSRRKEDTVSTGRHFGGSVIMVMIFAFGIGWMLDTGSGSLAFVFNA